MLIFINVRFNEFILDFFDKILPKKQKMHPELSFWVHLNISKVTVILHILKIQL